MQSGEALRGGERGRRGTAGRGRPLAPSSVRSGRGACQGGAVGRSSGARARLVSSRGKPSVMTNRDSAWSPRHEHGRPTQAGPRARGSYPSSFMSSSDESVELAWCVVCGCGVSKDRLACRLCVLGLCARSGVCRVCVAACAASDLCASALSCGVAQLCLLSYVMCGDSAFRSAFVPAYVPALNRDSKSSSSETAHGF